MFFIQYESHPFLLYKKSFALTIAQNFSGEKFAHEQIYGKL